MIGNESKVEVLEVQLDSLKSKVFILFALLVLTVGGLIYCLFTLLSQATPDLIQATRIQVVDDDGFPVIDLYRSEFDRHTAGNIAISTSKVPIPSAATLPTQNDSNGTLLLSIGADEELEVGLAIGKSLRTEKDLWYLGSNKFGDSGQLALYNFVGSPILAAYESNRGGSLHLHNGGSIHIENKFSQQVLSMLSSDSHNGQIILRERNEPSFLDIHGGKGIDDPSYLSVSQILPDKPDRPSGDQ